jgi:PAS domain S-box-containing protein
MSVGASGLNAALHAQLADAILDAAADAIVASDPDGIIRFWNPGAMRIFGFTAEEAVGRSLDIIIPERLRARHWEGYAAMMRSGRSRYGAGEVLAVPGIRKDGSQVSLEFTLVALKDDRDRVSGLVAVMRDVTARFEELKALRQRLRAALSEPASGGEAARS